MGDLSSSCIRLSLQIAVAAERYMAILLSLQYQRVMSPRNAQLALLVTWGLGAISGTVPLMDCMRQLAHSDYCIFTWWA
ncbi:hypothetical protein VZT92_015958 [Zoarces viviparus]|uniref:G-protein coupled receptors family 1 profile domain-containing protein n=1 Tax=Zoarces viviparus TaxID=48416 RepID=A0AAW1EV02_ZOAVI